MVDEADMKELFQINMLGGTGRKKLNSLLKMLESSGIKSLL